MTTEPVTTNRFAPPSNTNLVTQGTPAQMSLFGALNEAIRDDPAFRDCRLDYEKRVPRPDAPHAKNGSEKSYFVDIKLSDPRSGAKIAIEVYGEKSSATDEGRESFLKDGGYMFFPVSNDMALKQTKEVVRHLRRSLKILRELFA